MTDGTSLVRNDVVVFTTPGRHFTMLEAEPRGTDAYHGWGITGLLAVHVALKLISPVPDNPLTKIHRTLSTIMIATPMTMAATTPTSNHDNPKGIFMCSFQLQNGRGPAVESNRRESRSSLEGIWASVDSWLADWRVRATQAFWLLPAKL